MLQIQDMTFNGNDTEIFKSLIKIKKMFAHKCRKYISKHSEHSCTFMNTGTKAAYVSLLYICLVS